MTSSDRGKRCLAIIKTPTFTNGSTPYEPSFVEFTPEPSSDHEIPKVALKDYLFLEYTCLALDIIEEEMHQRRVKREPDPCRRAFVRLDDSFVDDLEEWPGLYDLALVRAENVLIDKTQNAWIPDSRGCHMEGWVDREMADSGRRFDRV